MEFTSFALNDDELAVLKQQLEEDDFGEVYRFIEGATEQSLGEIRADLDELLGEGSGMIVKKNEKKSEDTNPFTALFSFLIPKEEKKDFSMGIKKDSNYEKVVRSQAILLARFLCRKLYDDYKKSIGMQAFPPLMN